MLNARPGRPPRIVDAAPINVTLNRSQLDRLRRLAGERRTYVSVLVREAVDQAYPLHPEPQQ